MDLGFASATLGAGEFQRRQAMARRRGSPQWLWPEVAVESWAQAQADMTQAVAAMLAGDRAELSNIDPMAVSLAAYTSGVGPLLGWWCETGKLDARQGIKALLALHLEHSRAREQRLSAKARRIVAALRRADIPVAVLKGGHTAYSYFPLPAARPRSDLDLLVPSNRHPQAETVLAGQRQVNIDRGPRESGWVDPGGKREPRSVWLVHADDPWPVDLHQSLDYAGAGAGAPVVRLDLAGPLESPERWPLDSSVRVLSQPLLLLHLAVHASGGLGGLTLLRMVELILVIRKDLGSGRLSWDGFLELAERTGGLGGAYPALLMGERLAPGTVPAAVLERCASAAPARARAVVERHEPCNVHRVDGASVTEHFMWVSGPGAWLRQLRADLAPRKAWSVYQARAYRLLNGRISR